ncbi:DUF2975 domain-containing protein [Pelagibius sp. Alg239-R121]|uniref:DUF2975 domain-containing protein n=1 Tax=Pelagibius sp. Alg239-R121 TaxID=2993448 RepID=UPI0024A630AC|nr:DUF2975 domain-containing protein [Pelagibius sp. Alg239-R121]
MSNLNRIQRAGRVMSGLCLLIIFALPLILALVWTNLEHLGPEVLAQLPSQVRFEALGPGTLLLGFAINLLPVIVLIYGLIQLRRLFTSYSQGIIFSSEQAGRLRKFALASILSVCVQILSNSLLSVVLTFNNPPGNRQLAVSLSSDQLGTIFLGAVFLVIAWIMGEASRIAEDNAQIV